MSTRSQTTKMDNFLNACFSHKKSAFLKEYWVGLVLQEQLFCLALSSNNLVLHANADFRKIISANHNGPTRAVEGS